MFQRIFLTAFIVIFFILQWGTCFATVESVNPQDFQAGMLPDQWDTKIQESAPLPHGEGNGLQQFQTLLLGNIAQLVRYVMISVAVLYIFIDVLILILGGADASKHAKANAGYYLLGFMLIGLSSELVKIFDTAYLDGAIGNVGQLKHTAQYVINYISLISGTIAIFYMLIAALRMITAQGDDGIISKEKKSFQLGFMGLIVIIMADVMINKVFYPADIHAPSNQETQTFAQEIFAMTSYFLEFMAVVAIASLVLAGGYYVASMGNEEQTKKAQTILKNVALGFIMIAFAYTIVSAVSPSLAGQVTAQ